jgi:tryptophan synthase beta chain
MAPLVSHLRAQGIIEAVAYHQNEVFEAAVTFARTEGILPAPETAHAIKACMDEAVRCRQQKRADLLVFNFSGHGHFDLSAYDRYLAGELRDYAFPQVQMEAALADVPEVDLD